MHVGLLSRIDRFIIPFLFTIAVLVSFLSHRGSKMGNVIWSDGEGYYLYLPATFIYGDWKQFEDGDGLHMIACCAVNEDKVVQTRYTYGIALMQLPFFVGSHVYASIFHGPGYPPPSDYGTQADNQWAQEIIDRKWTSLRGQATGFSDIYAAGILLGAAFYLALGLFFIKQTLKRWFSLQTVLLTTALIFLATNLFYYATQEVGMSHVYSFFLFAWFLNLIPRLFDDFRLTTTVQMGLAVSLILLIRPTNIIICLTLLGFEVYRRDELKGRFMLLLSAWKHFLIMLLVFVIVLIPQMIYWKYAFGDWLAWSYGDEGFSNWYKPKIPHVLFSHQNGWFMYTPMMLLAVAGLYFGWRKKEWSAPVISLILLLATYTFASWWAWWFGGAFGHRCYVEFYALLAWPLAGMIDRGLKLDKQWLRAGMLLLLIGFVYANLKMTAMYQPPWDGENWTWSSYFGVLKAVFKFYWWPG